MNLTSVSLNRDSPRVLALKRVENLHLVGESGLASFLEESFPGCTIILFGSYALGEDTLKSDIDIAVIGTKGKQLDLSRFEKALEREIRITFFPGLVGMDKHLKSNICNGITLAGAVEL